MIEKEIEDLQGRNKKLENEIKDENLWMRRTVNDYYDSIENLLISLLNVIWMISSREQNCFEILKNVEILTIFVDLLMNDGNDEIQNASLGIFANLCQSEATRKKLSVIFKGKFYSVLKYVIDNYTQNPIEYNTKAFETSLIFINNCIFSNENLEFSLQNDILAYVSKLLYLCNTSTKIFDIVVQILNKLITYEQKKYYKFETIKSIFDHLKISMYTPDIIKLNTKIKSIFQEIKDEEDQKCFDN